MNGRMAAQTMVRERHFNLETLMTAALKRSIDLAEAGALVGSAVGLELLDAVRAAREEVGQCAVMRFPPAFRHSEGWGTYAAHTAFQRWTLAVTVAMTTRRGPSAELLGQGLTLLVGLRGCKERVR